MGRPAPQQPVGESGGSPAHHRAHIWTVSPEGILPEQAHLQAKMDPVAHMESQTANVSQYRRPCLVGNKKHNTAGPHTRNMLEAEIAQGSGSEGRAARNIRAVVALTTLEKGLRLLQKLTPTPLPCLPYLEGNPLCGRRYGQIPSLWGLAHILRSSYGSGGQQSLNWRESLKRHEPIKPQMCHVL